MSVLTASGETIPGAAQARLQRRLDSVVGVTPLPGGFVGRLVQLVQPDLQEHAPLSQLGDLLDVGEQVATGQRPGRTIRPSKMSSCMSAMTRSTTPMPSPLRS